MDVNYKHQNHWLKKKYNLILIIIKCNTHNLHPAQATVSPPSSESENLNKNVPVAYLVNMSSASDFLMNPIIALKNCI